MGLAEGLVRIGAPMVRRRAVSAHEHARDHRRARCRSGAPVAADERRRTSAPRHSGPRVQRDTRDNPFYPKRGSGARRRWPRSMERASAAGGRISISGRGSATTLSVGYVGRSSRGASPRARTDGRRAVLRPLSARQEPDLRGYTVGQYRDRALIAGAEWSIAPKLWRRVGGTVFVGAGGSGTGVRTGSDVE